MISLIGKFPVRTRLLITSFLMLLAATLVPAKAAGCEAQARALAAQQNARLLAVSAQGNKCVVKLLIKSNNKPPQRKTVVLDRK